MKKSKLSILLLFLVMILAISAVSAADSNDTSDSNLKAVDEAPVDEAASDDAGKLASTDSANVLSTGGKNFTELKDLIEHPDETKTITLQDNYTRVGNEELEGIVLGDGIILNGNGYTIDGNNNGGIFRINQGSLVILQNVILINGNGDNGGAIYNEGRLIIQANSQFSNNNASLGGAIYNNGYLAITGSTFENNNATNDGLSIYNNGNLSLTGDNSINGPIVNTENGRVTSDIKVTVLDNEVKEVNDPSVILNAKITDNSGNVIKQLGNLVKFTVDGVVVGNGTYDSVRQAYLCTYSLTNPGRYTVNVTYAGNKLIISSKEKNLVNYRGTFTDLQKMINANSTINLPYDITYNEVVDAANFPSGIVINKTITIDGKGNTISGNNAYRIFNVTANNVILRNVVLTKGKATYGGAIYVDNGGNLTTDATFKENTAAYGGAIYTTADLTVDQSTFIDNTATDGATINAAAGNLTVDGATFSGDKAVYISNGVNATISNSEFTSEELYAIRNFGTLELEKNTVKAILNGAGGKITSTIKVRVLEGSNTLYVEGSKVKLYANITDDNNNPIYQSGFKFIINNNVERDAVFNGNNLLYEADYTLPTFGEYLVNISYTGNAPKVEIINGTINYITGTFTDLERLINNTNAGETLELPYDFTYNPGYDGGKFPKGIVINKVITIDGKNHTISGNNSNHIFYVTANDVVLNNITFANSKSQNDIWGAVYTNADLTVANSTFLNNTVDNPGSEGAAICAYANVAIINLNIYSSNFINNTAISNGGGAIMLENDGYKIFYKIYDSLFENNAVLEGASTSVNGGAIWAYSYTEGVINNTRFIKNRAIMDDHGNGGAIKVMFGSTLTVANSTFEENTASKNGGAISIQSKTGIITSIIIDNCTFTGNSAINGSAFVSTHNSGSGEVTIINSKFDEDNAVYLDDDTTATISNSEFTSDKVNAITNFGTLELSGNTVKTIYNRGTITSQVNATVLGNETRETKEDKYNLTAILTDDKGNIIDDTRLKFVVVDASTTPNDPTYNTTTGVYTSADYPITMDKGTYLVSVSLGTTPIAVKTGIVKNLRVGTFTDLERLINGTTAGQTLFLPYDFTYSEDIDGTKFPNGIVINKAITIDGKGKTISGNNSNSIFIINASVTIKNTVFADVNGYAIKNNAELGLENNTISQTQALIINNGTISTAVVKVLEGKTVDLKFAQNVTLNATFTDDKGNWIKDDDFAFTLTNVASPITATYNPTTGLYTAKYTADKVETKTVSVDKIGTVAQLVNGTLEISQASVVITITANETIERKQNESITVTLIDEFDNPLSLGLNVYITNDVTQVNVKTYTPTTTAGVWSVEVPGLAIGNYTISVSFSGNENYLGNFKNAKFEVVELNITNTFTELQRLIESYEGTGNVLVLPHNFKYNDYVDEDFYANGVLISDDIVIDGNGTTIDSDNVYRIFNITDGITVTIKNVTLINGHASAADGAAIFTNADSLTIESSNFINSNSTDGGAIYIAEGNVTITDAKFINNTATAYGGAIFVAAGANLTVNGATFDNNTSPRSGAIRVGQGAFLTLSNSKFTNNLDDFNSTIGNLGTLTLDSNDVDGTIYNGGKITTPVYSIVSGNKTSNIVPILELTADLKDANGNLIYDPEFKFVVNDQTIDADYNATTGIYNATFNTASTVRVYVVNATSANEDNLITKISIFTNITGTFTDLQNLIRNATDKLELPYDFAYIALIDGDKFPNGVVIDEAITIDGKGHTISGSNSNRIFEVTAPTTLNNITLAEGNATGSGGAIYATANLNIYNSTFDSNVATSIAKGGAIMVTTDTAEITLIIKNVTFTNNRVDYGGAAIAVESTGGLQIDYNIYDSLFEDNAAITTKISAAGGALWTLGQTVGLINNTTFRGNKAETGNIASGGAISIESRAKLTVANSTFDSNVANVTGGAINIRAATETIQGRLIVENCTFTNNDAEFGSAIGSVQFSGLSYVTIVESNFNENNAVYLDNGTNVDIIKSEFTNTAGYAIYNLGTLKLSGNTVKSVIFNNGTITTQVNSTVLQNRTYDISGVYLFNLSASLIDDNYNKIHDPEFRFVVNGEPIVPTTYENGQYRYRLEIPTAERIYVVNATSANEDKLSTKISIVRQITGTFTDLQNKINEVPITGGNLVLPYDFIYTPEIDGDKFNQGVLISSPITITGNNKIISGNNSNRIFNVTGKNVVFVSTVLANGSCDADGAAIYVADGANITVNKASFENNIGNHGAVYVAEGGKLTVTESKFGENRAICNNGNAIVKNSEFTSEVIFAIFNNGTLELSKNTVELIYNNGTITSTVNATFIGNKTIAAELGDKVTPNATLTDDNGNAIYDASFDITVRGNVLETDYNVTTKLYSANYTIADAGKNIVTANYAATLNTGIYDVPKANVTEFTITVGDLEGRVAFGENATMIITLLGVNGTGLTETIGVIVNNTNIPVKVENGVAIVNISGLAPGKYAAVGYFTDNDNYNDAYATGPFTVLQPTAVLNVTVEDITYGDAVIVNISLTDNETGNPIPYNTTVRIVIAGTETVVIFKDGEASVEIPYSFAANEDGYLVNVTFVGDVNYDPVTNDTEIFKVSKASIGQITIIASALEVEAFDIVTFDFTIPIEGEYLIYENDKHQTVRLAAGEFRTSANFTVGNYTIKIVYPANQNYTEAVSNEINITVKPKVINPDSVIVLFEGDYSNPLNITLWAPVDGVYLIDLGTAHKYSINVTGGIGNMTIDMLRAGNYTYAIDIVDGNYSLKTIEGTFKYKAYPSFTVNITGTYPTATITISGSNGTYTVYIDDKEYVVVVKGTEASTTIPFITAGDHVATVVLDESNEYYSDVIPYYQFNIAQADLTVEPEVIGELIVDGPINITFKLPTDINASNVAALIDGVPVKELPVNETTGVYTVVFDGFAAGGHAFTVNVNDPNYVFTFAVKEFFIEKHNSTMETTVTPGEITYGDNVTISVNVGVNATGFVVIDVNGTECKVYLVNGVATKEIAGLNAGNYDVTVTYGGDDKYNNVTGSAKFTINKAESKVSIEPIADVIYGNPVEIVYEIINETSFVNIEIVDLNNPGKQIAFIDGNVLILVNDLAAGNYSITIHNGEDGNYKESSATATFNVLKNNTEIITEKEINSTIRDDVEIDYEILPAGVNDGNVTLWINDEEYGNFTIDRAIGSIKILSQYLPVVDTYVIKVQYRGNENYTESNVAVITLTVNKINITNDISIEGSQITYGETGTITVDFGNLANVTGTVNVTFHEINGIYNATVEDGVAIVEVPGLNGNATYHIAKVVYSGNDVYYGFTVEDERITIEVAQAPSVVEIDAIPDVTYPGSLVINYTVTNATTINVTVYDSKNKVVTSSQFAASEINYKGNLSLTDLPADRYLIIIENIANDNYATGADSAIFNVLKDDSGLTSTASENNTVGGNVTITVFSHSDATGEVYISVDGEIVVTGLPLVNGTAQFNVSGLAAGHHSYLVSYSGDTNYKPSIDENSFDVVKNDLVINSTSLDITVPKDTTTAIFTLTLPEDATGYLLVDIDGEPYYAPVENGTAILIVPGLNAGNYTANVTYTGDDKYAPVSNMTNVTVPSNLPENAISIPSSSSTYSPTYGVTLPKDAIGFIEVDVDGKKYYAVVQDGKASVSVPGLSTGAHNVTVTYSGDEKYTKISKSATVILTEPVVILVGTNVKYIYSAEGEYKVVVTIDGAPAVGKTVTVKFNGKNYNVVTDSKGYATLKLNTKVKPKKYTVTTTFMGAKATNKVTIKHLVKAKDAKVKQSKTVNKVKVALKKVDGKYLSGKKITIKFKGKKYKVKTNEKGKAKWKVKSSVLAKLKVGKKYKYSVTYGKDKVTKKLKIKA